EERAVYADEWFIGGDLARIDADGYVYYHGRDNELMNASGYRVSPLEVERCLQNHADVAEVAVTEVRLPSQVSLIVAYIVPVDAELPHAAEKKRNAMAIHILRYAAQHLAEYKCPRKVEFVDHLPRTASGKIQRRLLGERK
ncbi:MAG: hypothetical protein KDK34_11155, partial [Leptospiraceae bacterium]|nr:hypothetical protein [Leptospiraceae bacterium]